MFQPHTLGGKQLDQFDLSARTAGVAHWCILSLPDAVVPHRIGPGAGSPRGWDPPPPRRWLLLLAACDERISAGLAAPCGCTWPAAHPNVPPAFSRRENHLYVLALSRDWARTGTDEAPKTSLPRHECGATRRSDGPLE